MSYANVMMYGADLPSYEGKKDKGGVTKKQKEIRVDDPANREAARQVLDSFD